MVTPGVRFPGTHRGDAHEGVNLKSRSKRKKPSHEWRWLVPSWALLLVAVRPGSIPGNARGRRVIHPLAHGQENADSAPSPILGKGLFVNWKQRKALQEIEQCALYLGSLVDSARRGRPDVKAFRIQIQLAMRAISNLEDATTPEKKELQQRKLAALMKEKPNGKNIIF